MPANNKKTSQKGGSSVSKSIAVTTELVAATEHVVATELVAEPVAEPVVAEPVVAEPVVAEPVKQHGGKSKGGKQKSNKLETNQVVEPPAVVLEHPKQKGGGKKKTLSKVETEPILQTDAGATKAKVTKVTKVAKVAKVAKVNNDNLDQKAGTIKSKVVKQSKTPKKSDSEGDGELEKNEKGVRSFKVQLPGNEVFTGRFTGLTPYQAANKALSKYFRENKTVKTEISFAIKESTRGSKRGTYNYNGQREKLENPVKYSINGPDGVAREIVKEYKNKLIKVKKSESKELSL